MRKRKRKFSEECEGGGVKRLREEKRSSIGDEGRQRSSIGDYIRTYNIYVGSHHHSNNPFIPPLNPLSPSPPLPGAAFIMI